MYFGQQGIDWWGTAACISPLKPIYQDPDASQLKRTLNKVLAAAYWWKELVSPLG
jgi:hypothetical protein